MAALSEVAEDPHSLDQDKHQLMRCKYEAEAMTLVSVGYKVTCKDGCKWKVVKDSFPEKPQENESILQ